MKERNFKLCSKTLKTLINELSKPVHDKLLRKNLFVLQYTNIEKVEIFDVLHDKVVLLMRGRFKRGTRNVTKEFLERFKLCIQKC